MEPILRSNHNCVHFSLVLFVSLLAILSFLFSEVLADAAHSHYKNNTLFFCVHRVVL